MKHGNWIRAFAGMTLALALPVHAALDTREIDKAIDPCSDFYGHVNARWLAATAIPQDRSAWGTFAMVQKNNEEVLLAAHHWEPHWVSMQDIRKGPPPDNGLAGIAREVQA